MDCELVDRQVRCEPPSPFGSLTAAPLVLQDIDTLVVSEGQACARRGTSLLCFGQHWLGYADAGPGVIQFPEIASFSMEGQELAVVEASGRLRQFSLGRERPALEVDAVQVELGAGVGCVRDREDGVLCWGRRGQDEPHPLGLPPEVRVEKLVLKENSVCIAGTRWCAVSDAPLQDRALVVEVAP
jgi:hypothetical protein